MRFLHASALAAAVVLASNAAQAEPAYDQIEVRVRDASGNSIAGFNCNLDDAGGCGQQASSSNEIVRTAGTGGIVEKEVLSTVESGFSGRVTPLRDASGMRFAFDLRLVRVLDYVTVSTGSDRVSVPKTETYALSDFVYAEPTSTSWRYTGKLADGNTFTIDLSQS